MLRALIFMSVVAGLIVSLVGCDRVGEPWDKTDYFAAERSARTPEQQKRLRDRLGNTQTEGEYGLRQTTFERASDKDK
ncbi:MAG: hypothetical protein OEQ18_14235 [Gammaproteobacteria bacterium]|nr:hypothetical protein [Gammaproteobacteria bacterium]